MWVLFFRRIIAFHKPVEHIFSLCSIYSLCYSFCILSWLLKMKCAANIRNFFGKFAVHCKFLVFLGKICSALQISFCRIDNTFCKTVYPRICIYLVLLPDTSYSFYRPIHSIVCVYISRCCGYHTDEIHTGEGCLLGVTCQIKHCRREEIRA